MQFYLTKIALDKYDVCFCRVKQNLDWSMKENWNGYANKHFFFIIHSFFNEDAKNVQA